VQRLALDDAAGGQFQVEPMLAAPRLLAEAPLDAIAWNGTSGGWLGFDHDQAIVAAIEAETGIRAMTTTLAMNAIYRRAGWNRIAVVCPYTDDVTREIVAEYARHDLTVVATSNLGLVANIDMGNAAEATIREQLVSVATAKPDCIAVICTNRSAVTFTDALEREFGIPVVDSIAATFTEASRLCGIDVRIDGLGQLLSGNV
jgi:maleate isomerase